MDDVIIKGMARLATKRGGIMKIKITEIEATAAELKSCNSVADGVLALLKNALAPQFDYDDEDDEQEVET